MLKICGAFAKSKRKKMSFKRGNVGSTLFCQAKQSSKISIINFYHHGSPWSISRIFNSCLKEISWEEQKQMLRFPWREEINDTGRGTKVSPAHGEPKITLSFCKEKKGENQL